MPELTIDWIALTYPDAVPVRDTQAVFEGDWIALPHGGNGYRCAAQNGHLVLLYDANTGMGHHLRLSSQALRQVEAQADFPGWPQWLRQQRERGGKPTRIDLALDDTEGYLDFSTIIEHLEKRHLTTRHKRWGHSRDHWFGPDQGKPEAQIIRLGSRSSNTYLRIYDRAARLELPGHLIRFEIECKKVYALLLAQAIIDTQDDTALAELAVGLLRAVVDFKTPQADGNLSRAPLAPWWAQFCGEAEKVRLALGQPLRTIEKTKRWIERQAAPSLTSVIIAMQQQGESPEDWLAQVISSGERRLSTTHKQMIKDAQCTMRPRITERGRGQPEAETQPDALEARELDRGGKGDDHAGD